MVVTAFCLGVAAVRADLVSVTEIPGGWELTGTAGAEAHVLRLAKNAGWPAWSDARGNTFFDTLPSYPAVEVVDGPRVLYPAADATAEIKTNSAEEVEVIARSTNGLTVTWTVLPQRIGLRVDGPAATYTVRVRYPTHGESCRVHAGDQVRFATAGIGMLAGSPQLVVEARRTRALSLILPEGGTISWRLSPIGYQGEPDYLQAELALKPGQTFWLATESVPAYDGPIEAGFFTQTTFRRNGSVPSVRASLSSGQLRPGAAVTLTFPVALDTVLSNATVVAGLLPLVPGDPAETFLDWYWHFTPDVTPLLQALDVQLSGKTATITAPATTPAGVYRLRVWIAARDAARPAVLGGPKGAVVGFFPGIVRGQYSPLQAAPMADLFVSVPGASQGSLAVVTPDGRYDFWRGEPIDWLLQARPAAPPRAVTFTVRHIASGQVITSQSLTLTSAAEFVLPTDALAPGEYEARATAAGLESYPAAFTIAPPRVPGMALVASLLSGPYAIPAFARLGVNVWVDIMPGTGGYTPAWTDPLTATRGLMTAEPALPAAVRPGRNSYDDLVQGNWLWLQGVHSRQLDFFFYHSIPDQVEEDLRKKLVYAEFNQRFPSMLGLVFDYDLAGVSKAGSWGGGWETFGAAGEKRTALLEARWAQAWKEAQAKGATAADQARLHNLFMAGVIEERYRRSLAHLREQVPDQRHTTSTTADHATLEYGQYLPVIYRALDFRYMDVWNDQVYPCSANDMQESFWASLLRLEKPAAQPLWVTVSTAAQPGTHFRRSLEIIGRGVTGVGYCSEGGAGLGAGAGEPGPWGTDPTLNTPRTAAAMLSGDMTTRYGAFFNQFAPHEEVAILYSISQGGYNFAMSCPVYYAFYSLARLNRAARLLTEDQIAQGALVGTKVLVLAHQTASLPPATLAAIEHFAASGGKVICDRDTTLAVKGMQKLADVVWPTGLWPSCTDETHLILEAMAGKAPERAVQIVRQTLTYFHIDSIPKTQAQSLLAALGDAGRPVLEPVAGDALVLTKTAGDATLALVNNENEYPLHDVLTDDQLKGRFFRYFLQLGATFYKDIRVPRVMSFRLREDLAATPPRVYDVFAGRELRWQKDHTLTIDLATLQARALLLTPRPLELPTLFVGQRQPTDPRATIVVRSHTPLPIRVRVGHQEVFRAATATGSCDTFALGPQAQQTEVEMTELITGQTRRGTLELSTAAQARVEELPAIQVSDPAKIRGVLHRSHLAIYVDARQASQLDAAKRLAAKIPGAEVVFNPRVEDYVLDWDLPADLEATNARIRQQSALALRRPIRAYFQWVGAMQPALVWNRPAIVFGNAGNNRLIADMNSVTLLPRPAWPETIGAGRAVIGVAGAPFWNDQDVVYALCADAAGADAALEKLGTLAGSNGTLERPELRSHAKHGNEGGKEEGEDGPLAERRQQLGFEPFRYPANPVELRTKVVAGPKLVFEPCVPVVGLQATDDGVLVALGNPGRNLVRLDQRGREKWRTMTAGWYMPLELRANGAGEAVVRDVGESGYSDLALVWRHDAAGQVLWKMTGTPQTSPAADGSLWVSISQKLQRVSPAGAILDVVELKDPLVGVAPDGRRAFLRRPGTQPGYLNINAALVAIELPSGKELWSVPECDVAECRVSDDGQRVACVENENFGRRDDVAGPKLSRLTVVEAGTGQVRVRASLGQTVNGMQFTPDGARVMLREAGYTDRVDLADVATGLIRQVRLPEAGGWAHAFARDGRTLWVACEKLYGIDTDSLQIRTVDQGRIMQLLATPKGLCAGTADGRVLWLTAAGKLQRAVSLAEGIGVTDLQAELARLRAASLVDSPSLRPHDFPSTVSLAYEFPRCWGDTVELRGDAVQPLCLAVRAPVAGKYRFVIPIYNAKTEGDKLGTFRLSTDDGAQGQTQPVGGDKWQQVAVLDLQPGTKLIQILPAPGWKMNCLLRDMKLEKVE